MSTVTGWERAYFAAVGVLALWVGFWGYFVPARVDKAIPFLVPPLHARLLGAMYLSGLSLMIGGMLARHWSAIRVVPVMTAIWTGGLLVVSLLYLEEFDFATPQPWVWFAAYILYPLIAALLAWRHRGLEPERERSAAVPGWARRWLVVQGAVLNALAVALLLAPDVMVDLWPWPITPLLAQIYAAPFLAYGVGSLLLARMSYLDEIRVAVTGMLVFGAGVLLASILHRALFSAAQAADLLWFASLALTTAALATMSTLALGLRGGFERREVTR